MRKVHRCRFRFRHTSFFSLLFLHPLRHRFVAASYQAGILSAASRGEMADVEQLKKIDTLRSHFFQEVHHALAGSLRLDSKAALMPQIGLCAEKTVHSRACHLSRCMPKSWHVLCIRAVSVGPRKQIRESACQFHRIRSAPVCT